MFTQEELENIIIDGSVEVYNDHKKLGRKGLEERGKNRFGETSLVGDYRAEDVWINNLEEHNVKAMIISEEHGRIELGNEFTSHVDGLDGSKNRYPIFMSGDKNARYATIFSIYDGNDPRYEDYRVSAIIEHPTGRILLASKNRGIFLIDPLTRERSLVNVPFTGEFVTEKIRGNTHAGTKFFNSTIRPYLEAFPALDLQSDKVALRANSIYYVDFALGKADWVLDSTFKNNLEKAVAYPFVKERGGVMVSLDGKDIGPQKYFEFHFDSEDYVPIIAAPSIESAKPILEKIRKYYSSNDLFS
ncbi:MAG: hypothetical protein HYW24_05090 [Candidatus Aenigmarchaeota archaeon]|nr:hypothetical protein [Candidatus Aenigmarchaeota archaeon]